MAIQDLIRCNLFTDVGRFVANEAEARFMPAAQFQLEKLGITPQTREVPRAVVWHIVQPKQTDLPAVETIALPVAQRDSLVRLAGDQPESVFVAVPRLDEADLWLVDSKSERFSPLVANTWLIDAVLLAGLSKTTLTLDYLNQVAACGNQHMPLLRADVWLQENVERKRDLLKAGVEVNELEECESLGKQTWLMLLAVGR